MCDGETPMKCVLTNPITGRHPFHCRTGGCSLQARISGAVRYCDTMEHWEDPVENLSVIGSVSCANRLFKELYKFQKEVDRCFGNMKQSRLLGDHQYLGIAKVTLYAGLSVQTYVATMLAHVLAEELDEMRRMVIRFPGHLLH